MNCDEHQLISADYDRIRGERSTAVYGASARKLQDAPRSISHSSAPVTNPKPHTMVLGHDGSMFPSLEPTVGASAFATCISDQTGNPRLARNDGRSINRIRVDIWLNNTVAGSTGLVSN